MGAVLSEGQGLYTPLRYKSSASPGPASAWNPLITSAPTSLFCGRRHSAHPKLAGPGRLAGQLCVLTNITAVFCALAGSACKGRLGSSRVLPHPPGTDFSGSSPSAVPGFIHASLRLRIAACSAAAWAQPHCLVARNHQRDRYKSIITAINNYLFANVKPLLMILQRATCPGAWCCSRSR